MPPQFIPPAAPENVVVARAKVAKVRAAIDRTREANAATHGQLEAAEAAHIAEAASAALAGVSTPKVSTVLKSLRETAATADDVLAALERQLAEATAEHRNSVGTWGNALLRQQHAADATQARQAFSEVVKAVFRMLRHTGHSGRVVLREFVDALPRSDFGRAARYAWVPEVFGEINEPNPLNASYTYEEEAGFIRPDEGRHAAKKCGL
jgi:hypothetical protein